MFAVVLNLAITQPTPPTHFKNQVKPQPKPAAQTVPPVQAVAPPVAEQQAQVETVAPVVEAVAPTPTTHEELMAAAGINPADYGAVDYIVSHESSWNQDATEPTTGAHGLVQALPFSKTGCGWEDAVCTLAWGQQYAIERYGGWQQAMWYWQNHRNW